MSNLFSSELHVVREKTDMTNKKAIRATIKRAVDLHNQQKINENVLRSLVELAMAYEITTGLDEKIESKSKAMYKKLLR